MPTKKKGIRAVMALSVVSSQILLVAPFCSPVSRNYLSRSRDDNAGAAVVREHCDGCDDYDNDIALSPNLNSPIISIYTSRRKFIQYSMATIIYGSTSFSTFVSRAGADDHDDDGYNDDSYPPRVSKKMNDMDLPGPVPPFSSTRTYRNIVLSNGLKVVLVHDTLALRSSVALSIDGAGQFAEPETIPGLAHLMEHIVLSSTRSRRKNIIEREARTFWNKWESVNSGAGEEDFEDWLSEKDGQSNAFTAPGFVCFHFSSPHEVRFVVCTRHHIIAAYINRNLMHDLLKNKIEGSTGGVREICQALYT